MDWVKDPRVQSAIVAAVITLFGIILRDVIFKLWEEKRISIKTSLDIYKRYADPLVVAATSLMWRLDEVFYKKGRGEYLTNPRTEFEQYKKISTLYRIAALIGWIRGFRRELSFLQSHDRSKIKPIDSAIEAFEDALAEGPHIEKRRLEGLLKLWDLSLPTKTETEIKNELAVALNNILQPKLYATSVRIGTDLSEDEQLDLCRKAASMLCDRLKLKLLSDNIIKETKARAIQCLSIKEAWLYRDWQIAVGDIMLRPSEYEGRAFEVIGFGEFETCFLANRDQNERWLKRLTNLVEGIDVSGADQFDARIQQLKNVLKATSKLVLALAQVQHGEQLISEKTIENSRNILYGGDKDGKKENKA